MAAQSAQPTWDISRSAALIYCTFCSQTFSASVGKFLWIFEVKYLESSVEYLSVGDAGEIHGG